MQGPCETMHQAWCLRATAYSPFVSSFSINITYGEDLIVFFLIPYNELFVSDILISDYLFLKEVWPGLHVVY